MPLQLVRASCNQTPRAPNALLRGSVPTIESYSAFVSVNGVVIMLPLLVSAADVDPNGGIARIQLQSQFVLFDCLIVKFPLLQINAGINVLGNLLVLASLRK